MKIKNNIICILILVVLTTSCVSIQEKIINKSKSQNIQFKDFCNDLSDDKMHPIDRFIFAIDENGQVTVPWKIQNTAINSDKDFQKQFLNYLLLISQFRAWNNDNAESTVSFFESLKINPTSPQSSKNKLLNLNNKNNHKVEISPLRVLIFINGGLSTHKNLRKQACHQVPAMLDDGYFPLYFSWETGFIESYKEQILYVSQGEKRSSVRPINAPLSLVGDLGESISRALLNYKHHIQRWWQYEGKTLFKKSSTTATDDPVVTGDPVFDRFAFTKPIHSRRGQFNYKYMGLGEKRLILPIDLDSNLISLYKRLKRPIEILPQTIAITTLPGPGRSAWKNMLRGTRTTIHRPQEFNQLEWKLYLLKKEFQYLKDQSEKDYYDNETIFQSRLNQLIANKTIKEFMDKRRVIEQLEQFPKGTGGFAKWFAMLESCWNLAQSSKKGGTELVDHFRKMITERELDIGKFNKFLLNNNSHTKLNIAKEYVDIATGKSTYAKHCYDNAIYKALNQKTKGQDSLYDYPAELYRSLEHIELTLIGHSMGTIVANELLNRFTDLPIKNIVYMASAASIRETSLVMNSYLTNDQSKSDPIFYNLMLHPQSEALEQSLPFFPLGSLLEWIDETLGEPDTFPDRRMGKWENVALATHLFSQDARKNMIYRVFPSEHICEISENDKKYCDENNVRKPMPITHGSFNDYDPHLIRFWCQGFWYEDENLECI